MEGLMRIIFGFLAACASIYSILIVLRFIISWFGGAYNVKPVQLLNRVTDPYLDWWRARLNLRLGIMDLSPVAAIAALSVLQNVLFSLSRFDRITIGAICGIVLMSLWSVISFILIFCIIILIIRIFAYMTNRNIYSPFWKVIDSISQPLLYRTNRIVFGKKIPNYLKGIIISTLAIAAVWLAGGFLVPVFARLLAALPI
jgi:YggT family protein